MRLSGNPRYRGGRRWAWRAGGGLLALLIGVGVWLQVQLRGSLAQLEGVAPLAGLSAPVVVERDALGIPTIHGATRLDVARATGFVHAQERFFQMDLLRRTAAGELAELFGAIALDLDRANRLHRFRHRARQALTTAPTQDQALIAAYAAGVNAGLAALSAPPFEYLLLRTAPEPWRPEDTPLVVYAMYVDLQGQQWLRESARGVLHDRLPPALAAFLDPPGTEWDAPLQGESFTAPAPPGPDAFDLRRQPIPNTVSADAATRQSPAFALYAPVPAGESETASGSNNWAVAGGLTEHGGAVLANDMHLALRMPNIWYRASLRYSDAEGRERRIDGVTLPGAPAIVAGSNGRIAWGYTNSEGDWADLVVLESGADDASYQTPDGSRSLTRIQEMIAVKDGPPQTLEILETIWGPVVDRDHRGRQRALRWVAHDPRAVNLGLLALEWTDMLETALEIANRVGAPSQNMLLVSADGPIAWTLTGPIPHRFGHDGRLPSSWADGRRGWSGWLEPDQYPRIIDPPGGRLWTANGRVVHGEWLALLGDGGYALGARAKQIRDGLADRDRFDEADLLALQLDDRALFLERWRELLLATLTPEAVRTDPGRAEMRRFVAGWGGRAAVDSVGYRLVRTFRLKVWERAFAPLTTACRQADPRFDYALFRQNEGPLWQLVSQRPAHLLDPRYPDWPTLLRDAADAARMELTAAGRPLAAQTWGDYNQVWIQHPFSRVLPWLSAWLDLPMQSLPGDLHMPRVQTPGNGASQRLVVAPGREASGILHMPGGQSGHPLSPFYRAGHTAWAAGEPSPLAPGRILHRLQLQPAPRSGPPAGAEN
ncbi:MAG TPA: penicillin acylase family protein [Candidatus Contendobacter sp.]|nr:penicillin acylase family protein [Candidatus Contendobacter sp.]HRD49383.1 penicillin acylase family protein [Candidatus Contendobacter sp.]